MVRLRMFGQDMIVLGSPEVIFEMLDKRSANTSDRKQTPSISLYASYGSYYVFNI